MRLVQSECAGLRIRRVSREDHAVLLACNQALRRSSGTAPANVRPELFVPVPVSLVLDRLSVLYEETAAPRLTPVIVLPFALTTEPLAVPETRATFSPVLLPTIMLEFMSAVLLVICTALGPLLPVVDTPLSTTEDAPLADMPRVLPPFMVRELALPADHVSAGEGFEITAVSPGSNCRACAWLPTSIGMATMKTQDAGKLQSEGLNMGDMAIP